MLSRNQLHKKSSAVVLEADSQGPRQTWLREGSSILLWRHFLIRRRDCKMSCKTQSLMRDRRKVAVELNVNSEGEKTRRGGEGRRGEGRRGRIEAGDENIPEYLSSRTALRHLLLKGPPAQCPTLYLSSNIKHTILFREGPSERNSPGADCLLVEDKLKVCEVRRGSTEEGSE